jgi:hypothetical protein
VGKPTLCFGVILPEMKAGDRQAGNKRIGDIRVISVT